MIREVEKDDLQGLLELYLHLHESSVPEISGRINDVWNRILNDDNYHIIVAEEDGMIVSSCTVVIVPNLTRNASSYALVENVVTHENNPKTHDFYKKAGYFSEGKTAYYKLLKDVEWRHQ